MAESISHNSDTDTGNFVGATITEIRQRYQNHFNMDPKAIAFVNGTQVDEDYVIKEGDKIEFKSAANVKAKS